MDREYVKKILANIEHEVARIKTALAHGGLDTATIDDAGERISSFGDMIRDAL